MNKIKYLLAVCISLTVLSGPVLQAEQVSPKSTTIEVLKDAGVGVLNDGILDVSATQAAQLLKDNPRLKYSMYAPNGNITVATSLMLCKSTTTHLTLKKR